MSHDSYMTTRDKMDTAVVPSGRGITVSWGIAATALAVGGMLAGSGALSVGLLLGAVYSGYKGVSHYFEQRSDEKRAVADRKQATREMSEFQRDMDGPEVAQTITSGNARTWQQQFTRDSSRYSGRG